MAHVASWGTTAFASMAATASTSRLLTMMRVISATSASRSFARRRAVTSRKNTDSPVSSGVALTSNQPPIGSRLSSKVTSSPVSNAFWYSVSNREPAPLGNSDQRCRPTRC
ncbi:MAG: hypothetical protein QOI76_1346 [Frankiales bacterium]|nr:hypothetical protein [Frankiales bacterium]